MNMLYIRITLEFTSIYGNRTMAKFGIEFISLVPGRAFFQAIGSAIMETQQINQFLKELAQLFSNMYVGRYG